MTNELLNLDRRSEHPLRELAPQVLGAVIRRFHDFATAEDAVQEALMAAITQWPREGVPDNPRGWLTHVASRRMTDHVRTEMARRRRESELALDAVAATEWTAIETSPEEDETLVLLVLYRLQPGTLTEGSGRGRYAALREGQFVPRRTRFPARA